jgi:Zn-dependent protease with chaperone function
MEGLKDLSWSGGDAQTRMGVRSGKELRDKLFGFSRARHIGIGEIYMVDGSHRDARANAFVTGAGNHSIIGLYDTLFLGKRGKEASEDADDEEADLANSESLVQHVSDLVQGVNIEEEDNDKRAPRNSAPTQAMNDDEIVAILAHELAHSAMKHMEMGMVTQVFTSFVTFASLGWMAHSPLAAAALSLSTPMLHVGVCAYDNVVGPPIEGFMKLFTDGLTRHNEYEADAYATRISERYGTGLQTALAKLSVNSNQDPDPPWFFEALHSDHPPFARRWAHIEDVKKKTYGDKKKP